MFTSLAQTTAVSEKHRRLPIISECFAIKKIHVAVNYKQSVLGAFIDVHTSSSQGWLVRLFKLSRVQANKSLSAANDKSPTQVRLSARLSTAITENPFATIGDYSLSYFLAFSMRLQFNELDFSVRRMLQQWHHSEIDRKCCKHFNAVAGE